MFCKYCGSQLPDNARFCGNCGNAVSDGSYQYDTGAGYSNAQAASAAAYDPGRGKADADLSDCMIMGIIAIAAPFAGLFFGFIFLSIAGLVCGIIGMNKLGKTQVPEDMMTRYKNMKTLNIVGIVVSSLFTVVYILLILLLIGSFIGLCSSVDFSDIGYELMSHQLPPLMK